MKKASSAFSVQITLLPFVWTVDGVMLGKKLSGRRMRDSKSSDDGGRFIVDEAQVWQQRRSWLGRKAKAHDSIIFQRSKLFGGSIYRMKAIFYGLRNNHVYLVLITLVCGTVVLWAWEKTPFLTTVLPPQDHVMRLSPEISPSTKEVSDVEQVSEQKNSSKQGEKKNLVAPSSSVRTDSSVRGEDNNNLTSHVEKQACSYAKGKWVTDDGRPLYSGFGCKQWLSSMWSCRLTQRQDFQYEKLRWQPKDCKMEDFTGSKFLSR
ncbi:hypothetical protein TEA_028253 [Camellia sinensis var. sinensis]|uniref:Trichome birefringence-like N-terminal domain-containing protein n=1 Tax=Camellia sinensis var. sinensis TaxID=542762 RepID=A0A4S4DJF8_CAMSN|nr:hypothetical protein TEA_028253 [Camellia sinensis var. sinensis]